MIDIEHPDITRANRTGYPRPTVEEVMFPQLNGTVAKPESIHKSEAELDEMESDGELRNYIDYLEERCIDYEDLKSKIALLNLYIKQILS